MTIAAAQMAPRRGEVDANLRTHLRLITTAASRGARLILFPELSLTGYELDLAADLAFTLDDARLAPLKSEAASTGATIIAGAPVTLDERLHIGAVIITPNGATDVYTKHHLGAFPPELGPPPESTVFEPGDRAPLLPTPLGDAAIAVCADVGRPTHAATAASRGASLYLASMFLIPADLEAEHANLAAAARRHRMTVVMSNFTGESGGLPAAGRSAVWSSDGRLLGQAPTATEGMLLCDASSAHWHSA